MMEYKLRPHPHPLDLEASRGLSRTRLAKSCAPAAAALAAREPGRPPCRVQGAAQQGA